MRKQLSCPFCNGEAIILQRESQPRYCDHKKQMPKNARLIRKVEYPSKKFYEYRVPTYVPACVTKGCLGKYVNKYFYTKEEAIEAWNRRTGE